MTTTQQVDTECSRTPVPLRGNRLHWFAGRTHQVLDELGQPGTWAMTSRALGETVAELVTLRARIDAQLFAVLADADRADVAAEAGAVSTAAWVRGLTGLTGAEASRLVRQAVAVEGHQQTMGALADGSIHTAQAEAIVAAVDGLPEEVADQRAEAEAHLLGLTGEHDAKALRALGRHRLEVVAPDRADVLIARQLEAQEAEARRTTFLRTWRDGDGSLHGRFKIPGPHGAMLRAMLEAIANPARKDPIPREGAATPQVHGQAFCELLERISATSLPTTGGVNATVVVTMTLETLLGGLQAAGILGTGQLISPGEARRLACAAGIIPAVLGGKSELVDLGRRRKFSKPQRLAMALRQGGLCNIADCERPASWADAHHPIPWSKGGRSTLRNGELICPRHHTLVHQGFDYPRRT
jgi:hypothetical protein